MNELNLPKISLTENQLKVIKDKYLRDAPSVESWLHNIAHNIALAEILFHDKAEEWGAYAGVHNSGSGNGRLLHVGLNESRDREENFNKLISNLEKIYRLHPVANELVEKHAAEYYSLMATWDFLPNSPTLMNAGRELQQLSACYVLPVPDSMEGITKSLSAQSLIQKSGGGTGFAFSRIRPKGAIVKKTQGVASGALSFMQLFDKLTDVVKQGGTRRGANMGILHYTHPEIKDFIKMKLTPGVMENFNVSVAVDDKFMQAVAADSEYDLLDPKTGVSVGRQRAKEIFDMMIDFAHKSGDPGLIVIDRINNSGSNPTPALGQIESTNPCGEQPLLPWEPCNLGSINLSNFVMSSPSLKGTIDYPRLASTVESTVRFLDDVIEVNNYPLPEIEVMAKGNRRIGLGVMGWAEMLVKMEIAYDSPEALELAFHLMRFINDTALTASEKLAVTRGTFPNWKDSIYDADGLHYRGEQRKPRHCARTTIAPTGTIAIAAGLQGSGIEPFFAIAYTRYNAKALEMLKKGEEPNASDVFFEVNPLFKEVAAKHNFFGLKEADLWKKINDNHKAVRGIKEIPENIQKLFPSSHDVAVEIHVRMQAAFQKNVDNGVSKTINLPNSATVEDVRKSYKLAYDLGCKGITIYRDGSKSQQVLNLSSQTKKAEATPATKTRRRDPSAAFGVSSEYYQVRTGYGPLHVHINYDERGPYQIFTNIPPLGTEISGLTSLVGILLSKYLAEGGDPVRILKHLNSIKGDKATGFGDNRIDSIAHAISVVLRQHLKKTGWIEDPDGVKSSKVSLSEVLPSRPIAHPTSTYCEKCYSSNVAFESGCSEPSCKDCGHSKCS